MQSVLEDSMFGICISTAVRVRRVGADVWILVMKSVGMLSSMGMRWLASRMRLKVVGGEENCAGAGAGYRCRVRGGS